MLITWVPSVVLGLTVFVVARFDVMKNTPIMRGFARYDVWWSSIVREIRADERLASIPLAQLVAVLLIALACLLLEKTALIGLSVPLVLVPPFLLYRGRAKHKRRLVSQLPCLLIGLADALTTVPNLGQALASTAEHLESPMREEITQSLSEIRVGRSIDEALENMARRLRVPGIEATVSAALLGRRTGGDLPTILRRIANVLREMERLEGVIKTKTAEGRNQAIVMGIMPIILILALEKIDPDWLAPLWNDPLGALIVGAAAVLEVTAVALIRRITAVKV
jgi:tight adherence protein B